MNRRSNEKQIVGFSVHLISSTPGRHTGPDINKFGHLKLRQVIHDLKKNFLQIIFLDIKK